MCPASIAHVANLDHNLLVDLSASLVMELIVNLLFLTLFHLAELFFHGLKISWRNRRILVRALFVGCILFLLVLGGGVTDIDIDIINFFIVLVDAFVESTLSFEIRLHSR